MLESDPPGATVAVDGTFRGQTPIELLFAPGTTHELLLSKSGHEPETRSVELATGETRRLSVELREKLGEVEIAVQPKDAELYVNGEPRGRGDQVLRLVAVPHEIEVRRQGYEPYRTTVTPRPGYTQSIRVALKTSEQIKAETTPPVIRTAQGQELVLIPGGQLRMGASRREPGRRANETFRDVELTRAFYLATTEVSNKQFRDFRSEHLSGGISGYSLEFDHHPVVRVTWEEAAFFCNWLSKQESLTPVYTRIGGRVVATDPIGTGYRLPTEAEWAWAARYSGGKTPHKYPWGDALPVAKGSGNYADEAAEDLLPNELPEYDDGYPTTAPVESFKPDPLGLLNLGGNVAEWVHDVYAIYPSGAGGIEKDPVGPDEGDLHVIRGSSWMDSSVSELRLTYRDYGSKPRPDVGFRIARYAE